MNKFNNWLKHELKFRNWNHAELSRQSGLTPSVLSLIFSGERKPGVKTCTQIARALCLPLADVFCVAGFLPATPEYKEHAYHAKMLLNQIEDTDLIAKVESYIEYVSYEQRCRINRPRSV